MASLRLRSGLAAAALAASFFLPAPSRAADDPSAFDEVVRILRKGGLVDEAGEQKVKALYAAEQKRKSTPKWLEGFEFSGDMRARFDGSYFDQDALGGDRVNRGRGRYRARFGFIKNTGWARMGVRLASGVSAGDRRSGNASFGENANDEFSPDPIFFDRVFADFKLIDQEALQTQFVVGKTANPFVGGKFAGTDLIVMDHDINPEGAYLTTTFRAGEGTKITGSAGTFILKEVPGFSDPKMFGAQIGLETKLSSAVSLGLRASAYEFRSLAGDISNGAFPTSAPSATTFFSSALLTGNLPSAFRGSDKLRMGESSAYLQFDLVDGWPLLLYGTAVKNFTATAQSLTFDFDGTGPGLPALVNFPKEDMAYGVGFEFGDAAKFAKFGVAYFRVEANSVIGQLTDSDLFDGFTNRKGWAFFASRKLNSNVELRVTLFNGKELHDADPFQLSLPGARRRRVQADAIVSF